MTLGKVHKTDRGFEKLTFNDYYDIPCSLQESSISGGAIWLGTDDAKPVVMARDAAKVGVKTDEMTGWVPYPIPPEVSLSTRMHLKRRQVEDLIKHLQNWLDNDTFDL